MMLKQIYPRSIALLVVFAFSLFAERAGAATVSINIADGTHPVGDGAGFIPANNWNNLNYGGSDTTFDGLVDDTGAARPVTLRIRGNDRRTGAVGGSVDVNTNLFFGMAPAVATDNLPSKNHAFGPGTAYMLENLNASFPQGYDVYLYTEMWSFSTGTGGQVVVDNDPAVFGRGYNGHGPPWTGNVANLDFFMGNPSYDAGSGFIEGQNYLKLLDRSEDVLNFQPYPFFGPLFNSIMVTGLQIVGAGTASLPSDLTNNGFVDFADLTILLANWNKDVGAVDGNLVEPATTPVNFADLTVLLADWTGPGPAGSPEATLGEAVPEPSTLLLALLATFGLSFYRRRRRRST